MASAGILHRSKTARTPAAEGSLELEGAKPHWVNWISSRWEIGRIKLGHEKQSKFTSFVTSTLPLARTFGQDIDTDNDTTVLCWHHIHLTTGQNIDKDNNAAFMWWNHRLFTSCRQKHWLSFILCIGLVMHKDFVATLLPCRDYVCMYHMPNRTIEHVMH